jgi:hypothetical protein
MTTFRSEDLLVGLLSLGVVPWIAWTIARGLREGRLPIGRAYVRRDERRGAFASLLVVYVVCAGIAAVISADLLLGLGLRDES